MNNQRDGRSASPARSPSPSGRGGTTAKEKDVPQPPRGKPTGGQAPGRAPKSLIPQSVLAAGSKEAMQINAQIAAASADVNANPADPTAATDLSQLKLNSRGGVLITTEELKAAYELLDTQKTGYVTLNTLKKRLGFFYPEMSAKEYRFLMNNRKEITLHDLEELLIDNEVAGFDPVAEAFKLFDTEGEGSIPSSRLREVFSAYGFGEMSDSEFRVLQRSADIDGDGKISLGDFRAMLDSAEAVAVTK